MIGGYNYEHFTIFDNINITNERKEEIVSQYDKNSIWYLRDILGVRCVAEGLVYRTFVDNKEKFKVKSAEIKDNLRIKIGVDFGGTLSGHSFVATGITYDFKKVYALASERHFGDIDPNKLGDLFVDFVLKVINKYGMPEIIYPDSAESVLARGLRTALLKADINIPIVNAWKVEINDRIRLENRLIGQSRFYYTEDCESLEEAMSTAVYNPKSITKDERLDDGTSDIDTLDAFEYTIERDKDLLILMEVA